MKRQALQSIFASALACAALFGSAPRSAAQGPPGAGGPPPDPLGPDLYFAIRGNRIDQVNDLLSKGAKTEARNWLGITPLIWAAIRGNDQACAALLDHKANVNADSLFGGPLEFAVMNGSPKTVKLLIDRGARLSEKRSDKITALMGVADSGSADILRLLLPLKPDINAADLTGATALTHAARRGRTEVVQALLDAAAEVNTADSFGRTPLMYAAQNGYPDAVRALLARGAKVNERDRSGASALTLAARYSGEPTVATLLLNAGADKEARDAQGRGIAEVALRRGNRLCAIAIDPAARSMPAAAAGSLQDRARQAVQLSLPLIERTTHNFSEHSGCVSCHHQGVGLVATGTARSLGFKVDAPLAAAEQKIVLGDVQAGLADLRKLVPHPEAYKHFVAVDMNELSPAFGSSLCGLVGQGAPRSEAAEIAATLLARQQTDDGSWGYGFDRAPMQSSPFTMTAYAIQAMNAYLPAALDLERKERTRKALAWIHATPARTNEDRAFRLLALKWAGAPQPEIDRASSELRGAQRGDGGWAQFPEASPAGACFSRSDAYATGEALYALHVGAAVKPEDAVYRRGVEYLLRTQDEDGSWFVNKRAIPANNYFDTGFPHGESQFISYGATCWSTMALMFAANSK